MRPLLALFVLALAACHASTPLARVESRHAVTPTTSDLSAWHWQLVTATDPHGQRIDALFARAGRPLELVFDGHHLSVRHTCNAMGGDFRIDGDRLQLHALIHTMMACADPALNRLDQAIGARLRTRPRLTLENAAPPRLQLHTDTGDTLVFKGVKAATASP